MRKAFLVFVSLFVSGCATQAQLALQKEADVWQLALDEIAKECDVEPLTFFEYENSYTHSNVLKREKCELKILRNIVQPHVVSPTAYKELLDSSRALNVKFASRKLNAEEWRSEAELLGMIYNEKREAVMLPKHYKELEQMQGVHTSCFQNGAFLNCTTY